jgi:hypothetical protein
LWRDVTGLALIAGLAWGLWVVSLDALDAEARAADAKAAALAAQMTSEAAEVWALEAAMRRDTVCDCLWRMENDPKIRGALAHTAAIECQRCQIRTTLAEDIPPHDGEP